MFIDQEKNLELIWSIIHEYASEAWGDRIGHGHTETNDNEYEQEYSDVCLAMAQIREGLGLSDETEENDEELYKVVFRKFIKGGDIVALFPCIASDNFVANCLSYQRVGQHSGANYGHVMSITKRTTDDEHDALLAELKRVGYNNIQVCKRAPHDAAAQRSAQINKDYM